MKKSQKNIYIGIGILLVFVLIFSMFNNSGAIIDTSLSKIQTTYCADSNTVANSPIYQCKSTTGNTFYCVDTKQSTCQATYQNTIWSSCSKVSSCSGTSTGTSGITYTKNSALSYNCYNNANAICSQSSSLNGYALASSFGTRYWKDKCYYIDTDGASVQDTKANCFIKEDVCGFLLTNGYSTCEQLSQGVCSGDDRYYCSSGNTYKAKASDGTYDYYCPISGVPTELKFTTCPNGCSNGECAKQICLPNEQWCEGNTLKKCDANGMNVATTICSGTQLCQQYNTYNAMCRTPDNRFCLNQNGFSCITCDASRQDSFATLEECQSKQPYYCLSSDKTQCIKREGSCMINELSYRGTDIDMAYLSCSNNKIEIKCNSDIDCNDNFDCTIDKCEKNLLGSKCVNTYNNKCSTDDKKTCESNPLMSYNKYTTTSGGYLCDFLNIGCSKETTYKCETALWVWIVGYILLIFVLMMLYKIAKKKRWI